MTLAKTDLEDKVFNLETRQKQTTMRFEAINSQLDETITENAKLQGKLTTAHTNSFISTGANEEADAVQKANFERDQHKWNAEKLGLDAKILEQ